MNLHCCLFFFFFCLLVKNSRDVVDLNVVVTFVENRYGINNLFKPLMTSHGAFQTHSSSCVDVMVI